MKYHRVKNCIYKCYWYDSMANSLFPAVFTLCFLKYKKKYVLGPCLSSPVSFFLCGFLPAVLFCLPFFSACRSMQPVACGGISAPSPAHQSTLPPPLIRYARRQHIISPQIIHLNLWFKDLHVLNKLLVLVSETKWTIDGYFNTKWSCKQRVSVSQFSSKVECL